MEQTKEERADLLAQGLWPKCAREGCSNPAWRDIPGSCCSPSCRAYFNTNKRISRLKQYISENPERWSRLHIADADQIAKCSKSNKEKFKDHGPRKYESLSEYVNTSRTVKLGTQRMKAIKTGLRYTSSKGKFKVRYYKKREIPYRNEWDLKAFKSLDENPLVKSWSFLNQALPYPDKNDENREIPRHFPVDLEIEYRDGSRRMVILSPNGISVMYFGILRALEEYCLKEKIELEFWTKEYFTLPQ